MFFHRTILHIGIFGDTFSSFSNISGFVCGYLYSLPFLRGHCPSFDTSHPFHTALYLFLLSYSLSGHILALCGSSQQKLT